MSDSENVSASENVEVSPQNRVLYLDVIRVVAIFCVILIHVSLGDVYGDKLTSFDWLISNVFGAFVRTCVPLFVMASGALLLDVRKTESLQTFFRKRFARVLIPFLVWSMFYYWWRSYIHSEMLTPDEMLLMFLAGNVYTHLWFIYTIIGLYLVTPILRVFVRAAQKTDLQYFLWLWFVFSFGSPFLPDIFRFWQGIPTFVATGYVGYFVLGFYLHNSRKRHKLGKYVRRIVLITSITIFGTAILSMRSGKFDENLYNFLGPNVILASFYSFEWFRNIDWESLFQRRPFLGRAVSALSACSFGIYLVHYIVLEKVNNTRFGIGVLRDHFQALYFLPLSTTLSFLISFAIILAMKKIPIVKAIVP